jgi:hypothetical protein
MTCDVTLICPFESFVRNNLSIVLESSPLQNQTDVMGSHIEKNNSKIQKAIPPGTSTVIQRQNVMMADFFPEDISVCGARSCKRSS